MVVSLVELATSEKLKDPDWGINIKICDILKEYPGKAKDVVESLRKQLGSKNPMVQCLAIILLDSLLKNCADLVHTHVAQKHIYLEIAKIGTKESNAQVLDNLKILARTWEEVYGHTEHAGAAFSQVSGWSSHTTAPTQTHPSTSVARNQRQEVAGSAADSDFPTLSRTEIQNVHGTMDILAEMLNALDPKNKEARTMFWKLDHQTNQYEFALFNRCAMSLGGNYLKRIYVKRTPEANKTIHVVSSAFKAAGTWHNMRTLQECREACGGQGLKTENRVGHLKSEFDVQSTFEGDNNVLMQQVSKALIGEYVAVQRRKKPFQGLGLEHMNDPCPVVPTQLTSSIIRNTKFQYDIFCLRERDLLHRFAAEVSKLQVQGLSKEHAFIQSYQLAEDLARAFTEKAILKIFLDAEVAVSDGSTKSVFGLLRSMYALISMEEDSSFLRYGYLSQENAAAVRKEVANLCGELRPHALSVVSSFGIPDSFLSPIAFDWVAANSWSSV